MSRAARPSPPASSKGKQVVLFLSGMSMVNAAMTTQAALDRFKVTRVVFSGIAGGVDPALDVGDVVVADQWGAVPGERARPRDRARQVRAAAAASRWPRSSNPSA